LSNEIHENLGEGFLPESFSEVVRGFSGGEANEVEEFSVVSEFSCEVYFGGDVAQVDE
jgi:hypothetical protein